MNFAKAIVMLYFMLSFMVIYKLKDEAIISYDVRLISLALNVFLMLCLCLA